MPTLLYFSPSLPKIYLHPYFAATTVESELLLASDFAASELFLASDFAAYSRKPS